MRWQSFFTFNNTIMIKIHCSHFCLISKCLDVWTDRCVCVVLASGLMKGLSCQMMKDVSRAYENINGAPGTSCRNHTFRDGNINRKKLTLVSSLWTLLNNSNIGQWRRICNSKTEEEKEEEGGRTFLHVKQLLSFISMKVFFLYSCQKETGAY